MEESYRENCYLWHCSSVALQGSWAVEGKTKISVENYRKITWCQHHWTRISLEGLCFWPCL